MFPEAPVMNTVFLRFTQTSRRTAGGELIGMMSESMVRLDGAIRGRPANEWCA
jgi:hypothetical protein